MDVYIRKSSLLDSKHCRDFVNFAFAFVAFILFPLLGHVLVFALAFLSFTCSSFIELRWLRRRGACVTCARVVWVHRSPSAHRVPVSDMRVCLPCVHDGTMRTEYLLLYLAVTSLGFRFFSEFYYILFFAVAGTG